MELSNCNYVILQTNRARCALYKKILILLNEQNISGKADVELVYVFDENPTTNILKCESIAKVRFNFFLVHTYTYTVLPA